MVAHAFVISALERLKQEDCELGKPSETLSLKMRNNGWRVISEVTPGDPSLSLDTHMTDHSYLYIAPVLGVSVPSPKLRELQAHM